MFINPISQFDRKENQGVLKKLKVRKNLFLFLTNRFHFPEGFSFDFIKELDDLCLSLSERLEHVIAFRNKFAEGHDTYFSFIFEDKLIITECNNGKLKKSGLHSLIPKQGILGSKHNTEPVWRDKTQKGIEFPCQKNNRQRNNTMFRKHI